MSARHFLTLMDFSAAELRTVISRAMELKRGHRKDSDYMPMRNRTLALIFDKSSTRTRVSFEAAMTQFGGNSVFLTSGDTQLGRGEPVEDTARVMSRMVDAVVIRTSSHDMVQTFAAHADVPVINGLTDRYHPCQLLADVQTFTELRGDIAGSVAAWVGDGNNVCHSWMNAARRFDFTLRISTPRGYEPDAELLRVCGERAVLVDTPQEAAEGAHIVVTDTWASMGQELQMAERRERFVSHTVTPAIMKLADPQALFMHCLPVYRGFEAAAEVVDGPQSVIWEEAENRLHSHKALLEFLVAPHEA